MKRGIKKTRINKEYIKKKKQLTQNKQKKKRTKPHQKITEKEKEKEKEKRDHKKGSLRLSIQVYIPCVSVLIMCSRRDR